MTCEYELTDEMFLAACKAYGKCLHSEDCVEETTEFMIDTFKLDAETARDLAICAGKEWAEAYE